MKCKRHIEALNVSGGQMRRSQKALLLGIVVAILSGLASAANNPSVTITGTEQSSGGVWDYGTVKLTVNTSSATGSESSAETVSYGQFSTVASIASALAAAFTKDCSSAVNARATGAVITFQLRSNGGETSFTSASVTATTGDPGQFSQASFGANTSSLWSTATPYILSLSPTQGALGTVVTISGMNFGSSQGSSTVTINGTIVSPLSWDAGTIFLAVPSGVSTGSVVVTVGGIASNGVSFTVTNPACQF